MKRTYLLDFFEKTADKRADYIAVLQNNDAISYGEHRNRTCKVVAFTFLLFERRAV